MTATRYEPRNKFSAGDLGDATEVRKLEKGDKTVLPLGTVLGKVTGITFKFNPNNPETPSIALEGFFEGTSADPSRSVIRSTTFFPPGNVAKMVQTFILKGEPIPSQARSLKRGESVPVGIDGEAIPIAMEISVRKTDTAIGYEFVTDVADNGEMNKVDLLADVRGLLPGFGGVLALPAPDGATGSVATRKKRR